MRGPTLLLPVILSVSGLLAGCFASNLRPDGGSGGGGGWTNTGRGDAGGESACDPLAPKPITLGAIVGVGQDAAGTLYVDSANGIFVSTNAALVRQHVTGTGQSGANAFTFTFEAAGADASSARALLVNTQGSTATAMALGPADSKSFLGQSDAGVTSLSLVAPSLLAGLTVINTPNVISYIADVANGDVLLATVPLNADSTALAGGLSIFYGPPGAVAERPVTAFGESLSGNGSVSFLVGSATYVLQFGMIPGPDAGPFGTFALEGLMTGGDADVAVTLRSPTPTALPSGLSFTCLP
jgi:hypothetical protein